ncbi:bacteriorhodopsin [Halobaculum sp. CBA1158]|uniref:bacteriorhodopsin n=1 Tax=Halobaculum sp. CBA1158 TaxID=2904243 RepID=UPI001F45DB13|nr:bacteriorhodopsin [Halobaculum sp. CBA1158]UIO99108.1 bacteriorhodopsin [Halobaculum sp. CBA1158]
MIADALTPSIDGISSLVYGAGTLGMAVGIVVVWWLLRDETLDSDAGQFRYLLVIPAFATLSYASMTLGIGVFSVNGYDVEGMRYLDWLVTTPVLVGYVGHVVDVDRSVVYSAVGLDALMILTGFVATTTTGTVRWAGFAVSSLAFFLMLYIMFVQYPKRANTTTPERKRLFLRLRNQVGVLWLLYPVIWLASPVGFGLVSTLGTAMLVTFMDVAAKVPYTWVVHEHRGIFRNDRVDEVAAGSDPEATDATDAPVATAD